MSDNLDLDYDDYDGESVGRGKETLYLNFEAIVSETAKAWFVRFPMKPDLTNDDAWMPKSQCEIPNSEQKIIEVPRWLVEEKGLEEYQVTD